MAGSVNKAILVGHLGADPEIRRLNSGDPVASFSLATSETWRDKNSGERKEKTEWHRVVVFNENLARLAEQYLKKGMKVFVEGQIATRKYQGGDGQDRYVTEIVLQKFRGDVQMLDKLPSNRPPAAEDPGAYGRESSRGTGRDQPDQPDQRQSFANELDDEIPL